MGSKTVLQMYVGSWCGSCHAMEPVARAVTQELGIDLQVLDVESPTVQAEVPGALSVTTLPKFSLQRNGFEIAHIDGSTTKQDLLAMCKTAALQG